MNESREQDGTIPRAQYRLETGLEVIEDWAGTASPSHKNAIYEALFTMLDGTLFRDYRVIDDFRQLSELFVIVKDDLVMKIRINCFDSFGVVHIGPPASSARFGGSTR
jgi:hypothetical protein